LWLLSLLFCFIRLASLNTPSFYDWLDLDRLLLSLGYSEISPPVPQLIAHLTRAEISFVFLFPSSSMCCI
jgi:hypothetical protein